MKKDEWYTPKWFYDYFYKASVYFIRGRIKFSNSKNNPNFGSLLMVFNDDRYDRKVFDPLLSE